MDIMRSSSGVMNGGLGARYGSTTSVPSVVASAMGGPPQLRSQLEVGVPSPKSAEDLDDGGVFDISVVTPSSGSCLKKGMLAMQRDKVLSRWRDRYFMLMPDYLACFKKMSSTGVRGSVFPSASGMGSFQFKLSLVDIESADWADGTGLVIALNVKNDSRLLLRCVGDGRDAGNNFHHHLTSNGGNGNPNTTSPGFFPLAHSASSPVVPSGAGTSACTTPGQLKDWLRAIQSAVSCSKTRREALRNANRSTGFDPSLLKQRIAYERSVLDSPASQDSTTPVSKDANSKDPLSSTNHSASLLQAQQTRLMSNKVDKKYQRFSLLPDLNLSRYLDSWGFGSSSSSSSSNNGRTSGGVAGTSSPSHSDASSCSSASTAGSTSSASSTSSRDSGLGHHNNSNNSTNNNNNNGGNTTNGYQISTPLATSVVMATKRGSRYDMRPQSYADPLCTSDSPNAAPVLVRFRDRSAGDNNIRLYVGGASPTKSGSPSSSSSSTPTRHLYVSPATHV